MLQFRDTIWARFHPPPRWNVPWHRRTAQFDVFVEKSDNWKFNLLTPSRQKLFSVFMQLICAAFTSVLNVGFSRWTCLLLCSNISAHVSEVSSLCMRSQPVSCSIEWGKRTQTSSGLLCVHSWSCLCISAAFSYHPIQAESLFKFPFRCVFLSLNGKYK